MRMRAEPAGGTQQLAQTGNAQPGYAAVQPPAVLLAAAPEDLLLARAQW